MTPRINTITLKAVSMLQKSTPAKELNHLKAFIWFAETVCLKLNSVEMVKLSMARRKMGPKMFFLLEFLNILQYPS